MITNSESGTNVHEIAEGIYRINTPVAIPGAGGFSFNQYLIVDDEPLLFHTGPRALFPEVKAAVASLIEPQTMRWIGFSHFESDECTTVPEWQQLAPHSQVFCSLGGKIW